MINESKSYVVQSVFTPRSILSHTHTHTKYSILHVEKIIKELLFGIVPLQRPSVSVNIQFGIRTAVQYLNDQRDFAQVLFQVALPRLNGVWVRIPEPVLRRQLGHLGVREFGSKLRRAGV